MAAVKSTREWGESGREATATLTIAQIHKYTIKQIQMKDKYNHYPVSSKTSNPSIREHVQPTWNKTQEDDDICQNPNVNLRCVNGPFLSAGRKVLQVSL